MPKKFLLNRRQFLIAAGLATGAAVVGSRTGCALPGRQPSLVETPGVGVLVSGEANTIHTTCNMCSNFCATSAIHETVAGNGRVVRRVEGRAGNPNTRGGLCAKGQAAVQLLYDPNRLKTPVRKRADGTWEERSWTDALNDVADGLQKVRGTTAGSDTSEGQAAASRVYFLNRRTSYSPIWGAFRAEFGSKNTAASATVCDAGKRLGTWLAVNSPRRVRDQRATNYTLLFGRNELEAPRYRLAFTKELLQNVKRGTNRLVVVDPRFTYTAAKANEHVSPVPGTDLLLILSMCRVILENSLTAEGRGTATITRDAANWVTTHWANVARMADASLARLAAFRDEVMKPRYVPATAAAVCGVPAGTITRLAGEFCGVITPGGSDIVANRARPDNWAAVADTTSGIVMYSHGTMSAWAMNCLTGLAGGFNIAGGYLATVTQGVAHSWSFASPGLGARADNSLNREAGFPFSGDVPTANTEGYRTLIPYAILNGLPTNHPNFRRVPAGPLATTGVITDAGGQRWINVHSGGQAAGGGGIRGLVVNHTDPVIADADSNLWAKALPHLQFAVAVDVYLNSTHELFPPGSYVLPECTALERTDAVAPTGVAGSPVLNLFQKVVEPLHNSRSGYWIFTSLAAAMSTRHGVADGYFAPNAPAAIYNLGSPGSAGRIHKHNPNNEADFTRSQWDGVNIGTVRSWAYLTRDGGWWTDATPTTAVEPEVRFSLTANETSAAGNVNMHQFRQVWENTAAAAFTTPLAPHWRPPQNTPTEQFPLRFMAGGKVMWHTMGATANLPYLVQDFDAQAEVRLNNALLINPANAPAGVVTGSWLIVTSPTGRLRVQALVTDRIRPGYVSLFHGFGHQAPTMVTAHNRGVNANMLTSSLRIDAGTGQFTVKEEIVQVVSG